jgi:hypothetical protein
MSYNVYWLRLPEHNDMFLQGYVGITNNTSRRFKEHLTKTKNAHLKNAINKYGLDNIIKEVIIVADKAYCLMIESLLRNNDSIGWNLIKGGGIPPSAKGNKYRLGIPGWSKGLKLSDSHRENLSVSHMGQVAWNKGKQGIQVAWNKGIPMSDESKEKLRLSKIGKTVSMETKIKMRNAHIKRHALRRLGEQHGE